MITLRKTLCSGSFVSSVPASSAIQQETSYFQRRCGETLVYHSRWRTVCSLSVWWCLDSSSYARSLSACGSIRNLRMVHRFSHSVRFSGLGFSFHRSSSHSHPWTGKSDFLTWLLLAATFANRAWDTLALFISCWISS